MLQTRETPGARSQPVTEYQLSGDGTKIVFRAGTEETMALDYNGQLFRGRSLQREQGALGTVVSVMVEAVPDLHTITLSLAVPDANLPSTDRSVQVRTFAVLTTARTSIGGPGLVSGQIQDYKLIPLEGSAR